ncbi:MAG: cellulose biosynthesis cyclic di-GMP-binding regulatory protein BcsB [Microcoleus sp. SIO2G3]|nr:cellulose biosynthesis cyclic di-GMP-binding regulatory protein BcsB [Microcoleus sp. SIO2G3]
MQLPFPLRSGKLLDGQGNAYPGDIGLLMLTTIETDEGNIPVLVATGNASEGVTKAVQFLVQGRDREIGTGNAILITNLDEIASPDPRQWKGYLPTANRFQLGDLQDANRQPFQEVTVHGANAPPVQIPFRALPDDRFSRGSTMKLHYSYSPQINPRTSALEVRLDGTTIASKRLGSNWFGNTSGRESFNVNLPEALIQPDSVLDVQFVLNPRESASCGLETDQSLFGTVHTDTTFNLNRDNVVQLPDLTLLKTGYPIAAPQDLSAAAIVLPDAPTDADVSTLLAFSKRMGRLTQADSVKLMVYRAGMLPADVRSNEQIVGIGTRDRFPFPDALSSGGSLNLSSTFTRQRQQSTIQTLPDSEGVIKQVILPEGDRTILALTAQTDAGLQDVQDLFDRDPLFSQLRGDTVLIRRTQEEPSPYDASGYTLEFLQQATPRRIVNTGFFERISLFLQDYWLLVPTGIIGIALLLYVFSQLYLNRVARSSGDLK